MNLKLCVPQVGIYISGCLIVYYNILQSSQVKSLKTCEYTPTILDLFQGLMKCESGASQQIQNYRNIVIR